ncbi:MAG: hypothetical protein MN733_28910, partial [Nitrososphaera sp.]|nr:hypothetical protein [Nitrososphaera sp.]
MSIQLEFLVTLKRQAHSLSENWDEKHCCDDDEDYNESSLGDVPENKLDQSQPYHYQETEAY